MPRLALIAFIVLSITAAVPLASQSTAGFDMSLDKNVTIAAPGAE